MMTFNFLDVVFLFRKHNPLKQYMKKSTNNISFSKKISIKYGFKTDVIWRNVLLFLYFHIAAFYGGYLLFSAGTWNIFFWSLLLVIVAGLGVTAGSHRLWSHRSYKAKLPLRIILMIAQTMAFQKDIYEWSRDHRVHHKYTHTNADPHNPERGYFFAHIGWLMMKKHDDVLIKGNGIDVSDVEADPVVKFQRKYYPILVAIFCFILPATIPWYFWNENWLVCCFTPTLFRFAISLNITLMINSVAHAYGSRPYDKRIGPADNAYAAFLSLGDGWHNYHHVFPWDYKTGELGGYSFNTTTMVIDFFSYIGWAYDMKAASVELINNRIKRTGDNTQAYMYKNPYDHLQYKDGLWGWDDDDLKIEDKKKANVYKQLEE